jgi:hypothetical protein
MRWKTGLNRSIGVAFALLAAAVALAKLGGQVDPDRVVATVNGEDIKGAEYYYRMEYLPGVGKLMGSQVAEFPPGFMTLEQIITERLVFQLAKQQGVYPSDLEVQDELASRIRRVPKLADNWAATGRSSDELKYQVRFELAKFNIATAGVTITDQEISNYYTKNPDMFTTPKRMKLKVIVVRTADEESAVDKDLTAGKSFADTATAHSQDATKLVGGDYGTVPVAYLGDAIRTVLEKTKIGENTDWITSNKSAAETIYVKFHLDDVIAAKLQPLDADLRTDIRHKMMLQRGAIKNDIGKEMSQIRSQAKIDIKDKTFADNYKRLIDAYLKTTGEQ